MGHFHSEKMSIHILGMLMDRTSSETWLDEWGDLRASNVFSSGKIIPLKTSDIVEYFLKKLDAAKELLDSKYVKEHHPRTRKMLIDLVELEYSMSCSDGCFTDKGMLEMAAGSILDVWEKMGLVEETDEGYVLVREKFMEYQWEEMVIKEMEL